MNRNTTNKLEETSIELFVSGICKVFEANANGSFNKGERRALSLLIMQGCVCISVSDYISLRIIAYKLLYPDGYLSRFKN